MKKVKRFRFWVLLCTWSLILGYCQLNFAQAQYGNFKLIDANTDSEIRAFSDDFTHFLSEADSLNIVAEPFATNYTHVRFTSSDGHVQTEGVAPYAYRGDSNGDFGFTQTGASLYYGWAPPPGPLDFTVEYLINGVVQNTDFFTITFEANPPTPSSTSLWNSNGSTAYFNSGSVGIGTSTPGEFRLAVNGPIRAKEVKVESSNWPDYVFTEDYDLPSLEEVQKHIDKNGHLFNIPSALEIKTNGLELGEMNRLLLEKIEELTLYILENKAEIESIKTSIKNKNND